MLDFSHLSVEDRWDVTHDFPPRQTRAPTMAPTTPEPPEKPAVDPQSALLVRIAECQDRAAFAALFQWAGPRVKGYMRKLGCDDALAEDLVQDVMLTVWRKAPQFDPAKAQASTWIFTIARNQRIDRIRREKHPDLNPDDPILMPQAEPLADEALGQAQSGQRVQDALKSLPPEQAEIIALSYYEDRPQSEIAAQLNLPLGTVKSRLRLAFRRLRAVLGETQP